MLGADIEVPNSIVDKVSQMESACYPYGTFYPLSCSPTMRYYRITITRFRACSTCQSLSQASFYYYIRHMLSIHTEPTFVLLRYSLGECRPSKTTTHALSLYQIHGIKLELTPYSRRYFTVVSTQSRDCAS